MCCFVVVGEADGAAPLGLSALVEDDLCPLDVAVLLEEVLELLNSVNAFVRVV